MLSQFKKAASIKSQGVVNNFSFAVLSLCAGVHMLSKLLLRELCSWSQLWWWELIIHPWAEQSRLKWWIWSKFLTNACCSRQLFPLIFRCAYWLCHRAEGSTSPLKLENNYCNFPSCAANRCWEDTVCLVVVLPLTICFMSYFTVC